MRRVVECRKGRDLTWILFLGLILPAGADTTQSWDWPKDNATGAPKRTLTVVFDPSVDNFTQQTGVNLRQAVTTAVNNWNAVKAETGWEFKVDNTSTTGDIVIKSGDSPTPDGGATASLKTNNNHEAAQGTITFDPTPEGFARDSKGRMIWDRAIGDWRAVSWTWGGSGGLNPVGAAMHEITHMARKKHERNSSNQALANTGDMTNPLTPGNNQTTPSAHDKENMNYSCTAPVYNIAMPMAPAGGFICLPGPPRSGAPGACLQILPGGLPFPAEIGMTPLEDLSVPASNQFWPELGKISVGVRVESPDPGVTFLIAAHVTIFYDNGAFDDPIYGKTQEAGLQAFMYDPVLESWSPLGPAEVNPRNDTAAFSIPGPGTYGIAGPFDYAPEWLASVGGTAVPADFGGDRANLGVKVEFYQDGLLSRTDRLLLGTDGSFTISDAVPEGVYDLMIKVETFLPVLVSSRILAPGFNDLGLVTLTNGDCDADNAITSTDLSIVLGNMD